MPKILQVCGKASETVLMTKMPLQLLALWLCIVSSVAQALGEQGKDYPRQTYNLCFLSLNNPDEYKDTKKYFSDLNLAAEKTVLNVVELQPFAEYPITALTKAISQQKCDGLVLSGHHRKKGFDGDRVPGYLDTQDLLRLSCSQGFAPWFQDVRHLWLQGCATGLSEKQNVPIFSQNFSNAFPNATTYTWSGNAPSKAAPKTIPFQFTNFFAIQEQKVGSKMQPEFLVQKFFNSDDLQANRHAWKMLRTSESENWKGIFNNKANSIPALLENPKNESAHQAICEIATNKSTSKVLAGIKILTEDKRAFLSNLAYLLEFLREHDTVHLRLSKKAESIIRQTVTSKKQDPLLRLRARNFFHLLTPNPKESLSSEKELLDAALAAVSRMDKSWDQVERKHYRWEIFRELLLPERTAERPLLVPSATAKITGAPALVALTKVLIELSPKNISGFAHAIANHPDANHSIQRNLAILSPVAVTISKDEDQNIRNDNQALEKQAVHQAGPSQVSEF